MQMSSALVGPNISPHYITISFDPLNFKYIATFAAIIVGSPPGATLRNASKTKSREVSKPQIWMF